MDATEYNAKVYVDKVREIAHVQHELHSLISKAMQDIQDAFPETGVGSPEWDELHAMMQATGIVGNIAYRRVQGKPSIFGESFTPPF
jgi:hypothetical protein